MSAGARASSSLSGGRKAAILIALMGEEAASSVLDIFPSGMCIWSPGSCRRLAPCRRNWLTRFWKSTAAQPRRRKFVTQGGADFARRLLAKTFGAEQAKGVMKQVAGLQEASARPVGISEESRPIATGKVRRKRTSADDCARACSPG